VLILKKLLIKSGGGTGPMKPGSLIIQGANSRGFPKDEAIGKNMTSSFEEVYLFACMTSLGKSP